MGLLENEGNSMMGDLPEGKIFKTSTEWYELESELRETVESTNFCQRKNEEEICRMCARLAMDVPMCQQLGYVEPAG